MVRWALWLLGIAGKENINMVYAGFSSSFPWCYRSWWIDVFISHLAVNLVTFCHWSHFGGKTIAFTQHAPTSRYPAITYIPLSSIHLHPVTQYSPTSRYPAFTYIPLPSIHLHPVTQHAPSSRYPACTYIPLRSIHPIPKSGKHVACCINVPATVTPSLVLGRKASNTVRNVPHLCSHHITLTAPSQCAGH